MSGSPAGSPDLSVRKLQQRRPDTPLSGRYFCAVIVHTYGKVLRFYFHCDDNPKGYQLRHRHGMAPTVQVPGTVWHGHLA